MANMKAIVGSAEFIASGSVVLMKGERAQIFPFPEQNEYSFFLRIESDVNIIDNGNWKVDVNQFPVELLIKRPWLNGGSVLSYGMIIAQSETENVRFAVNSTGYGPVENHIIFATYTIYKSAKT